MTARRRHRARGATASGTASCPGIPPAGAPSGAMPRGRQLPQRHGRVASLLRWRAFASACRTEARFPANRAPGTGHRAPGTGSMIPASDATRSTLLCAGLQLTGAAPAAGSHPSGFRPGTRYPSATTTRARCPGAMSLSLPACGKRQAADRLDPERASGKAPCRRRLPVPGRQARAAACLPGQATGAAIRGRPLATSPRGQGRLTRCPPAPSNVRPLPSAAFTCAR